MQNNSLSIIMPALNEENNIEKAVISAINAINKYDIDGELIIINDGSTDNTAHIIQKLSENYSNIKIIKHESPKGIGYSFWEGAKLSDKDVVVMFPGDGETDADESLLFYDLINNVDIIIPFFHNIEVRDRGRRIISAIYNFIMNMSFGIKLNYHNGTVFYRRVLLDDVELKNFGFFYQAELLIKLIRKGYLFAEIPNYLGQRLSGESKALTFKSFMQVAIGYLNLAYYVHIKQFENKKDYRKLHPQSITNLRSLAFKNKLKIEKSK